MATPGPLMSLLPRFLNLLPFYCSDVRSLVSEPYADFVEGYSREVTGSNSFAFEKTEATRLWSPLYFRGPNYKEPRTKDWRQSMKRILFSSALVATILMGGVLAYAIWKAAPVTSQQFLDSGKKYFEQKKYAEAIIQFLNSIHKDARNREARYLLAMSY